MDKDFENEIYEECKSKHLYDYENDQYKPKILITNEYAKCDTLEFVPFNLYSYIICDMYSRFLRMNTNNVLFLSAINDLSSSTFKLLNENNIDFYNIESKYKENLDRLNVSYDSRYFIKTTNKDFITFVDSFFTRNFNKNIFYDLDNVYMTPLKDKVHNVFDLKEENNRYFNENSEEVFQGPSNVVYLDFSKYDTVLIKEIEKLDIDQKYKNYIFDKLKLFNSLEVNFYINQDLSIDIDFLNPEYLAGITFICLNPNLIDVYKYVTDEDREFVDNYIKNKDGEFIFSGNYAINPLTGKEICIFISTYFNEDIHAGIPGVDEKDQIFNNILGLKKEDILDNDTIVNSDFLSGLSIEEAREKIINIFVNEGIGKIKKHLKNNRIVLSNFEAGGLPVPLEVSRGKKINSLNEELFPIYYNKFLKLMFGKTIDKPIELININFNDTFIDAMMDIYLSQEKHYFNDSNFLNNKVNVISEKSIFNRIVVPLIFKIIDNIEIKNDRYVIYHQNYNDLIYINQMNNLNVTFVTDTTKLFFSDAIRLYVLYDYTEELEASIKKISDLDYFINKVIQKYNEEFSYENIDLSSQLYVLAYELNDLAKNLDFLTYFKKIQNFFFVKIENKAWCEEDALTFLKLLSILTPVCAQYLYKTRFNGRDYLMYETFPTLD